MPLGDITDDAEADLREIVRYTIKKCGVKQANSYRNALNNTFTRIGKNDLIERHFSHNLSDVVVTKCQHHYIFYFKTGVPKPVNVGVIH